MGLANFWPQKSAIGALDIVGLTTYANALNACAASLNGCWTGNTDKQYVMAALDRQIQAVNQLRNNVNWVSQTANFVLEKLNELGKLTGFSAPNVTTVGAIAFSGGCSAQTRIRLNTSEVHTAADNLNGKRASLANSQSGLLRARNIIDVFILGIWGIGGKLTAANTQISDLLNRHDKIVGALHRIADLYDAADKRLAQKACGIQAKGLVADGVGAANNTLPNTTAQSQFEYMTRQYGYGLLELVAKYGVEFLAGAMEGVFTGKLSQLLGAGAGLTSKAGKSFAGKAAPVIGAVIGFAQEFFIDSADKPMQERVTNSAVEAGLSAGCAVAGAAIGTAIFPGLGTVGGLVVGAAVGLTLDAVVHFKVPIVDKSIADLAKDGANVIVNTVVDVVKGIPDAANATGAWLGDRLGDLVSATGNVVTGAANTIVDVGKGVSVAANATGEWLGDRLGDAVNITGDFLGGTGQAIAGWLGW